MANLENLKKQAKALVRLHRERSHHLAITAREFLPRFAGLSDQEVLAADFRLSDAQELLARQHGRESWAELKAGPPGHSAEERAHAAPRLLLPQPHLYVADVARAVAYYEQALGFTRRVYAGEPPFYAEVERDGAVLSLRFVHRPVIEPAARAEEMLWQAGVRVSNAKALYLEFLAAGAVMETPLRREPWGAWDFSVRDPDGNVVGFAEAAPQDR